MTEKRNKSSMKRDLFLIRACSSNMPLMCCRETRVDICVNIVINRFDKIHFLIERLYYNYSYYFDIVFMLLVRTVYKL